MSEWDFLGYIKEIMAVIAAPIIGWFMYRAKQHEKRFERLETKTTELETDTEILKVKIDMIFRDIKDIKAGIDKLIERQFK